MLCLYSELFNFKANLKLSTMLSPDNVSASLRTPPSGAQCSPSTPPSPSTPSTSLPALTRRISSANDLPPRYNIKGYFHKFTMITKFIQCTYKMKLTTLGTHSVHCHCTYVSHYFRQQCWSFDTQHKVMLHPHSSYVIQWDLYCSCTDTLHRLSTRCMIHTTVTIKDAGYSSLIN